MIVWYTNTRERGGQRRWFHWTYGHPNVGMVTIMDRNESWLIVPGTLRYEDFA